MVAPFDGKFCVVVSAPSYRDTVYVGKVWRDGDLLRVEPAVMVVRYENGATAGLTLDPSTAKRVRPAHGPVWIPLVSVAQIAQADADAWAKRMGQPYDL